MWLWLFVCGAERLRWVGVREFKHLVEENSGITSYIFSLLFIADPPTLGG